MEKKSSLNIDKVNFLKEIREKEVMNGYDKSISRVVKYVKSVYEKKITKAIEKNYKADYVRVRLPLYYRNFDQEVLKSVLKKEFNELGFRISIYGDKSCFCPMTFICNFSYGVEIRF